MKVKRFAVGVYWTNCYVVYSDAKDAIVVDPGGPMDEVRAFLRDNGLSLKRILVTHGHGDHIYGLPEISPLASEGVAIHSGDAQCLTDSHKNLSFAMGSPVSVSSADRVLSDGDVIEAGSMSVRVIHTPGHTPGCCCFYITEGDQELLISGDTLFARSVGRTDLPGGDEEELYRSLGKLVPLSDSLAVYPGHGPDTTIGEERRLNPFWPR
ncbi:MAG: MBL fold metallo-hydrolase [Synergistaceae bacterium]|nr:MBL fold metallo-hydrolase [Synergistaceae bacterium]